MNTIDDPTKLVRQDAILGGLSIDQLPGFNQGFKECLIRLINRRDIILAVLMESVYVAHFIQNLYFKINNANENLQVLSNV